MIPDEDVERVREAADIVAIISEHVRLKRVGSVYRGPCPFHQGTNNNFSVMPKGGYTCFVCGEKGNVFTFVQKRLGLTFAEAVKYVGEKAGIEVREISKQREGPDPREPFWEMNATSAEWFREQLWNSDRGAAAREYLASRGISRETADRWELGYAPRELGLLRAHMANLGWDEERLLQAGLLVKRAEEEELRPRFRDRLMFAILDAQSRHTAFGGRLLGPGEPKYLNSAESDVFHKGQTLYGLHFARGAMRREERAILVEGYFDVVRLSEAGVEPVVAPLGTALTEGQAELLRRHAKTVFIAYDSDAPGQKATFRAADALLAQGVAVRIVTMPDGEDPDTFVRAHGRDGMERMISTALDVFDRKVQLLERGGWFADLQRKRRALDSLLPTIRAAKDPITREMYLARAAEAAKVDRGVLARELDAGVGRRARPTTHAPAARRPVDAGLEKDQKVPSESLNHEPYDSLVKAAESERTLVHIMLVHRELADTVIEAVSRLMDETGESPEVVGVDTETEFGDSALRDPLYRLMYDVLRETDPALRGGELMSALAQHLDPMAVRLAEEMFETSAAVAEPQKHLHDAIGVLRARQAGERMEALGRLIALAQGAEKDELIARQLALQKDEIASGVSRRWGMLRKK